MQCFHPLVSPVLWCCMTTRFACCWARSSFNSPPMITNMRLAAMPLLLTWQCVKCSSWWTAPWSRKITALGSDVPSMQNPNAMFKWLGERGINGRNVVLARHLSKFFATGSKGYENGSRENTAAPFHLLLKEWNPIQEQPCCVTVMQLNTWQCWRPTTQPTEIHIGLFLCPWTSKLRNPLMTQQTTCTLTELVTHCRRDLVSCLEK